MKSRKFSEFYIFFNSAEVTNPSQPSIEHNFPCMSPPKYEVNDQKIAAQFFQFSKFFPTFFLFVNFENVKI